MLSISEPTSEPPVELNARARALGPRDLRLAAAVGSLLGTAYLILFLRSVFFESYETWVAYIMAPGLFFAAAPVLRRMLLTVERDPWIRSVVVWGLAAKLLGAFARFYTNEFVLGRGDSAVYHRHGTSLSGQFRSFIFDGPVVQESLPDLNGTPFIRLLTGLLYTVTGPTRLGGFVAFSFLSFWGLYLFYRAHRIALPDALGRRYAVLLFFLPSMVFWPSSIGKEAWMTTMLGLGAYGVARILTHQRWGYLAAVAALGGMAIVRPHVAAIFFVGLVVALSTRRSDSPTGQVKKVFGLMFLAGLSILLAGQIQAFFELDSLDAQEVFDRTTERSAQGGSAFETSQPSSIGGLPWAFVTVLFRPFLFEVGGAVGVISSVEGSVLVGLFLWNLRSVGRAVRSLLTQPFVAMVVAYTFLFVVAFSAVSNFGILARQRTQLYPLAMVLLTIPPAVTAGRDRTLGPLAQRSITPVSDRPSAGSVRPASVRAAQRVSIDGSPESVPPRRVDSVSRAREHPNFVAPAPHAESNRYRTVLAFVGVGCVAGLTVLAWTTRSSDDEIGPVATFERLIPTAVSSTLPTTSTVVAPTPTPSASSTETTADAEPITTTTTTAPPASTVAPTRPPPTTARPTTTTTQAPTTTEPPTIPDVTFPPPTVVPTTAAP